MRFPQEMVDALDKWAVANGVSRSEAVRDLVAERLSAPKPKAKR
jgi:metal-responsive CopG/Arc/MetJ family transcriptional regulator